MDKQQIQQLIQQEIEAYMKNKQFNYSKIQSHEHNGVDTVKVPTSSIREAIQLQGKSGGLIAETTLRGQMVNNSYDVNGNPKNPQSISILPINIIYGFGVGDHSQFEFGDAVDGTMVFFDNGAISCLCIKTRIAWYQINVDTITPI